jgi:hypothetical protein
MVEKSPTEFIVRRYSLGEERALFDIYRESLTKVTARDYTREQIERWVSLGDEKSITGMP